MQGQFMQQTYAQNTLYWFIFKTTYVRYQIITNDLTLNLNKILVGNKSFYDQYNMAWE